MDYGTPPFFGMGAALVGLLSGKIVPVECVSHASPTSPAMPANVIYAHKAPSPRNPKP